MSKKNMVLGRASITALAGACALGLVALVAAPVALDTQQAYAGSARTQPAGEQQVAQAATKEPRTSTDGATTTVTTTTRGGWTVTCSEGGEAKTKTCSANFRVINKQNNTVVLVWLIGRNAEGKLLAEFLTVTDVMIQPGVAVTLEDAKAVKASYVSCTTKGCKASLDLTPNLVRQMKEAKKAKIDVTLVDGQIIQFAMDIPGIDMALADLGL